MRRGSGWAAVALLVVVPLACGKGGTTKQAFLAKGDAICQRLSDESGKVAAPTSAAGVGPYLDKLVAIAVRARADFAALDAPTDGTHVRDALVGSLEATIAKARQARTAAATGDTAAMQQRLGEAGTAAARADKEAKAYGFGACANAAGG